VVGLIFGVVCGTLDLLISLLAVPLPPVVPGGFGFLWGNAHKLAFGGRIQVD
jgi:hypothetical protein